MKRLLANSLIAINAMRNWYTTYSMVITIALLVSRNISDH
jgi:hypothetical protein